MQRDQIVAFIHTIPIFHWLQREHLQRLAEAATSRDFVTGEVLLGGDQQAHELFVVLFSTVPLEYRIRLLIIPVSYFSLS